MEYSIIYTKNRKFQRIFFKSDDISSVRRKFKKLYEKNVNVVLPKKNVVTSKGMEQYSKECLLVRDAPNYSNFKPRILKSLDGKYSKEVLVDNYVIMDKFSIEIEEKFIVYENKIKQKKTAPQILKMYVLPHSKNILPIYILDNKIVFNKVLIIAKKSSDCARIYRFFYDMLSIQPFCKLMWMGDVADAVRGDIIDEAHKISGLSKNRIYRKQSKG